MIVTNPTRGWNDGFLRRDKHLYMRSEWGSGLTLSALLLGKVVSCCCCRTRGGPRRLRISSLEERSGSDPRQAAPDRDSVLSDYPKSSRLIPSTVITP